MIERIMPIASKFTPGARTHIAREVIAGKISYRKASAKYGVSKHSIWRWVCTEKAGGPQPLKGMVKEGRIPMDLRKRLTAAMLYGQITPSEAAVIAGCHSTTCHAWLRGASAAAARDDYLRRLFPDILGKPRSPAPSGRNQAKETENV